MNKQRKNKQNIDSTHKSDESIFQYRRTIGKRAKSSSSDIRRTHFSSATCPENDFCQSIKQCYTLHPLHMTPFSFPILRIVDLYFIFLHFDIGSENVQYSICTILYVSSLWFKKKINIPFERVFSTLSVINFQFTFCIFKNSLVCENYYEKDETIKQLSVYDFLNKKRQRLRQRRSEVNTL